MLSVKHTVYWLHRPHYFLFCSPDLSNSQNSPSQWPRWLKDNVRALRMRPDCSEPWRVWPFWSHTQLSGCTAAGERFPCDPRRVISRTSLRDTAHRNELLILFPKIIHPFVLWSHLRQKKMICFLYLIRADGRERRCGGSLHVLAAVNHPQNYKVRHSGSTHWSMHIQKKKCWEFINHFLLYLIDLFCLSLTCF